MKNPLDGLDPYQAEAVLASERRLILLAAAGAGKTRTLVARVTHLLQQGVEPASIVVTTFTRKAAAEMRERLTHALDEGLVGQLQIGTMHAHLYAWLRRHTPDEPGVWLQPDASEGSDEFHTHGAEANASSDERRAARQHTGRYGFDDLEDEWALRLGRCSAELDAWLMTLEEILVDEAQDLSHTQAALLLAMQARAGDGLRLTLIGDDFQSIYAFRGAEPTFLIRCSRDPSWRTCLLGTNYRCRADIVDAAQRLIEHNLHRTTKQSRAHRSGGGSIQLSLHADPWAEACASFGWLREEDDADEDTTAVLLRTHDLCLIWETVAFLRGLRVAPLRGEVTDHWRDHPALVARLRMLRWLCAVPLPEDLVAWETLAQRRGWTGGMDELLRLQHGWDGRAPAPWDAWRRLLDLGRAPCGERWLDVIDEGVDEIAPAARNRALAWWRGTFPRAPSALTYLRQVELWPHLPAVCALGTIHQSKGLQWPRVLLPRWEEGVLPWKRARDNPAALEEERRIAYVAMTRAEDALWVSTTGAPQGWSRFLGEAGLDPRGGRTTRWWRYARERFSTSDE